MTRFFYILKIHQVIPQRSSIFLYSNIKVDLALSWGQKKSYVEEIFFL